MPRHEDEVRNLRTAWMRLPSPGLALLVAQGPPRVRLAVVKLISESPSAQALGDLNSLSGCQAACSKGLAKYEQQRRIGT